MLTAAIFALWGVHLDLTGTLTMGDRTEVRARTYQGEAQIAYDAVTTPFARLELVGERGSCSLAYLPSVTMADLELGADPQLFQVFSSSASWRASRTLRLAFTEDGSYGTQNYSYLSPTTSPAAPPGAAPAPPAALQLLPGAETLLYGSSRTSAALQALASPTVQTAATASFFVGGELDAASRLVLPLQKTPRVELATTLQGDRRDTWTTKVALTDTAFTPRPCDPATGDAPTAASLASAPGATCAPHNDLVELTETLRRRLTRRDDLTLSAGATGVHARLDPGGERDRVFPTGSIDWLHRLKLGDAGRGELSADVRLAPVVDVRLGTIDQRGQAVASFRWLDGRASVTVGGGVTQSVFASEPSAVTFLAFNGEGLYAVGNDARFEIGGGYRGAWQEQQPFTPFFSNVLYAVLVYHEPAVRLWP